MFLGVFSVDLLAVMKLTRYLSSPTFLLLLVIWLIIIGLALNISSCRKKSDATELVTPDDTLAPKITNRHIPGIESIIQADTLAPKIINMHIPGIPPENIKIDQVKRQLIVTLPKDLLTTKTNNVFLKLTDGATLVRFVSVGISYCGATFYNPTNAGILSANFIPDSKKIVITDGLNNKVYRLLIVPGAICFLPNRIEFSGVKQEALAMT